MNIKIIFAALFISSAMICTSCELLDTFSSEDSETRDQDSEDTDQDTETTDQDSESKVRSRLTGIVGTKHASHEVVADYSFTYNDKGLLVEARETIQDRLIEYEYNGSDQLVTATYHKGGLAMPEARYTFTYQDELLIRDTRQFEGGDIYPCKYYYDGNSRLTRLVDYTPSGNCEEKKDYVWAGDVLNEGTQYMSISTGTDPDLVTWSLESKEVYDNNAFGFVSKMTEYEYDGTISEEQVFYYDSNSNLVKKETDDDSSVDTDIYTYDENGRMTSLDYGDKIYRFSYETGNRIYPFDSKTNLVFSAPDNYLEILYFIWELDLY